MIGIEHGVVTAARERGYPPGTPLENRDTYENRLEFAEDHAVEFTRFVLSKVDPELLGCFIDENRFTYRKWLN